MAEPEEWLTVAECAERLGVTQPRLRRMLARPEFAQQIREQERHTRTGMRTTTIIPVLVLPSLQSALFIDQSRSNENDNRNENIRRAEQERERKQVRTEAPINDRAALVESLRSEIEFLRGQAERHGQEIERRDVAESELRRLLLADREEIRKLRAQLALPEGPKEEAPVEIGPPASPVPRTDDLGQDAANAAPEPAPPAKRSAWRKFWNAVFNPWGE